MCKSILEFGSLGVHLKRGLIFYFCCNFRLKAAVSALVLVSLVRLIFLVP